jgi:hypothetical protein
VIFAATTLQFAAALLAVLRAVVARALPRQAAMLGFSWPVATERPWLLAGVLWLDVLNDWVNRGINSYLPAPNGPPLVGLARAAAHVGLAAYAAWVCGILGYVAWLARHRVPKLVFAAGSLWLMFIATNVALYADVRGDVALRALGVLHIITFVCEVPCLVTFAHSRGDKLGTERICGFWLSFLCLAAGIGPLQPWEKGAIDRSAAEQLMGVAMVALYASIVVTIVVGGVRWFCRCCYGRGRLPPSQS